MTTSFATYLPAAARALRVEAPAWDRVHTAIQRAITLPWEPTPLDGEPPPWSLSWTDLMILSRTNDFTRRRPLLALFRDRDRLENHGRLSSWERIKGGGSYDEELNRKRYLLFPMGEVSRYHLRAIAEAKRRGETIPSRVLDAYPPETLRHYGLV